MRPNDMKAAHNMAGVAGAFGSSLCFGVMTCILLRLCGEAANSGVLSWRQEGALIFVTFLLTGLSWFVGVLFAKILDQS